MTLSVHRTTSLFDAPKNRLHFIKDGLTIPFMLYGVVLHFDYMYFVSSWNKTGGFALKMVSDVRDGFMDPN